MTSEETNRKIGASNKITAKRYWDSLTESQKIKTGSAKTWFQKGQVSHNKGKMTPLKTRKKQSHSATLRFQTQKHTHEGTHRSNATKKLLREARLRQSPMSFKETAPENYHCITMIKRTPLHQKQTKVTVYFKKYVENIYGNNLFPIYIFSKLLY